MSNAANGGAAARMQRLLAMVPWIVAQDGPLTSEVCARFEVTPEQLAADLEVIWLVGLPPYTPDALIDVKQEGDRVWIRFAEVFGKPQRLTPDQAVALLTAGASVLALPGAEPDGPLGRGVRKLAGVLGVDVSQVLEVDLGAAGVEVLDLLRRGVSEHRQLHLDYYSFARDARSQRNVNPYLVEAQDGSLYLLAYCHQAEADRRFRVDRIVSATLLDDTFVAPPTMEEWRLFEPDASDPRVVLDLDPAAAWVIETYPMESVETRPDGRQRVTVAVTAEPWLARLLLALGPQAQVVTGPPGLIDAGRRAAGEILARYP